MFMETGLYSLLLNLEAAALFPVTSAIVLSSLESVFSSSGPLPVVIPHWISEPFSPNAASSWAPSGLKGAPGKPHSHHPVLPTLYEPISSGFLWVERVKLPLPLAEWERPGSAAGHRHGRR